MLGKIRNKDRMYTEVLDVAAISRNNWKDSLSTKVDDLLALSAQNTAALTAITEKSKEK